MALIIKLKPFCKNINGFVLLEACVPAHMEQSAHGNSYLLVRTHLNSDYRGTLIFAERSQATFKRE